jgi:hypothetical protein
MSQIPELISDHRKLQFCWYGHQSVCSCCWKESTKVVGALIALDDKNEEE